MFIPSHQLFLQLLTSTEVHAATFVHLTSLRSPPPPSILSQAQSNLDWNRMF